MTEHVKRFLEVYECSVAVSAGRQQVLHDGGAGQSRVVAAKTSLGWVQFHPVRSVEEMQDQEPPEKPAVHAHESDRQIVVEVPSRMHILGDHVHVSRVPRRRHAPAGPAKIK